MKRKALTILLTAYGILISIQCCYSQESFEQKAVKGFLASPNVASLGIYGQIPVSHFTGAPQIDIPLYDLTEDGVTVPIALSYHIDLVKPRTIPSWVGLGWGLSSGGSITRIPNGYRDETEAYPGHRYIDNYYKLNRDTWDAPIKKEDKDYLNDIVGGNDFQPDEFIFNFGNYSGSFWLNHLGQWQVRSSNGMPLKIEAKSLYNVPPIFISNSGGPSPSEYPYDNNEYMQFTITIEDGTQYIFGSLNSDSKIDDTGTDSRRNNNYVEGTHSRLLTEGGLLTPMTVLQGYIDTWHLRQIITTDNHKINFNYKRGTVIATSFEYLQEWGQTVYWDLPPIFASTHCESALVQTPSYLQSISTDECNISFYSSASTQLKPYTVAISNLHVEFEQLDSILIKTTNNDLIKKIIFNYTNGSQERLKLLSVTDCGNASSGKGISHTFSYHQTKLPSYESLQLDHWGYYNGRTYSIGSIYEDRSVIDTSCLKAEILEQITYPTGGKAWFEYEPHEYSRFVKPPQREKCIDEIFLGMDGQPTECANFLLSGIENNQQTGGLRIKRIKLLDSDDHITKDTEYHYSIDYYHLADDWSSGILAGKPCYYDKYSFKCGGQDAYYYVFEDRCPGILNFTNGSHITYSEVTEIVKGNGFTVYKYTNFDSGGEFMDIGGGYTSVFPLPENQKDFVFISNAYKRGKILKKEEYSEDKSLKRETIYDYKVYPDTSCLVRSFIRWWIPVCETNSVYGAAYGFFTNNYNLTRQQIFDYSSVFNGNNSVVSTITYDYNANNLLSKQSVVQSDGVERFTKYFYPFDDFLMHEPNDVLTKMTNNHILSNCVEKQVTLGTNVYASMIAIERNNFVEVFPNIFKIERVDMLQSNNPVNISTLIMDPSQFIKPEMYYKYDYKGNIIEITPAGSNMPTTYLWGYNHQYPIAEIIGVGYNELLNNISPANQSFMAFMLARNITPDDPMYLSFREMLIAAAPNAQIITYTYKPLVGMTSKTDQQGITTYYDYDDFNRLKCIKDNAGNIIGNYEYHYQNQ